MQCGTDSRARVKASLTDISYEILAVIGLREVVILTEKIGGSRDVC